MRSASAYLPTGFAVLLTLTGCSSISHSPLTHHERTERIPQIDNAQVRTWRTVITPNQPLKLHRHDHPRVVTVLKGGTLNILSPSGELEATREWKAGESYWLDADPPHKTHFSINVGKEDIDVVITELK